MRLPHLLLAATCLAAPLQAAAAQTETTHHHAHPHHHEPAHRHTHPAPHHTAHAPTHHPAIVPAPTPPPPVVEPPPPPPPPAGSVTGLPLPRFASFRSEEVNMRSGPGTRYPIQWVYKRRDLPIEIEREYDVWRLVETQDGTKGWVHQATLIGNRTFVTLPASSSASATGSLATAQTVRATATDDGAPTAYLKPGVIGHVLSCPAASDWCRVAAGGVTGFLPRRAMWGLLPGEVVAAH
jgi:SH3-like domain-containing protein